MKFQLLFFNTVMWLLIHVLWLYLGSEISPLCAKLFIKNIKMYLQFISFLHTDMTQVVENLPLISQELTYSTWSISWVLMSWRCMEPGYQQPWYWLCWSRVMKFPHVKGSDVILIRQQLYNRLGLESSQQTLHCIPSWLPWIFPGGPLIFNGALRKYPG